MNRRTFIQKGSTAATLAWLPLACASESNPETIEVEEATINDLQSGMESGKYTSRELIEKYLQRIQEIDQQGPMLRSVIEVNSEALAIADQRDEERQQGNVRSPLHGIPVMVKDNIDTADQMETTAGSLALVGSKPAQDAFLVQQLREAGAVLLGKTNLSEWANFRSTRSSSGWSGRGGAEVYGIRAVIRGAPELGIERGGLGLADVVAGLDLLGEELGMRGKRVGESHAALTLQLGRIVRGLDLGFVQLGVEVVLGRGNGIVTNLSQQLGVVALKAFDS